MKRVLFMLASVLCFTAVYAQSEKEIKAAQKEAQSVLKNAKRELEGEDGNLQTAFSLIKKAMQSEYTKNDAQTWQIAGDVYKQLYSMENLKGAKKQEYDTVAMYDYLTKMYDSYNRCDSLEQIPNDKGKTSTACRDKVASNLDAQRTEFINGGIFYFNHRRDYAKAFEIFAKYYEVGKMPMLKSYTEDNLKYEEYDKQFAYFTALAAYNIEDFENVLKYSELGIEDPENGETCCRFKCDALQKLDRTDEWVEALKDGIKRFPTEDYYYMQLLVYYDKNGKLEEMDSFVEDMIKVDPDKSYNYYVKGYLKQNQKNYAEAIESYKVAIEKDPELEEAYINEGLCYLLDAQEFMESKSDVKFNTPAYKQMIEDEKVYYKNALPLYEKVRELSPNDVKKWGIQLYSIYAKLNMVSEFDKMELILKSEGMLE